MILCVVGASPDALYAPLLVEGLVRADNEVQVVLDEKARLFVGPSAFSALSRIVSEPDSTPEAVVFFPAGAGAVSRLAHGLAPSAAFARISDAVPVYVAPDVGDGMQSHEAVLRNVERLRGDGLRVIAGYEGGPDVGEVLAAVLGGMGGPLGPLNGKRVVVSAGGTREPVDSVRFIGNRSSGKMGLAVARVARSMGAEVEVVAANIEVREPGVVWSPVETVDELRESVLGAVAGADALVMAAAVSDFRPASAVEDKIRRGGRENLTLELTSTSDVLAEVREKNPDLFIVGFAATHGDPVADAREKLKKKGVDLVVGNDISKAGVGFASDENEVYIVGKDGERFIKKTGKNEVARAILEDLISGMSGQTERNGLHG